MKLSKIIIFYPSFEKGGVENVLINLINYFLSKKIKVTLISGKFKNKQIQKNKLFKLKNVVSKKNFFLNNRIKKSLSAVRILRQELKKSSNKNSILFSLQSSSLSVILGKFYNFKIVIRNAEDPIYSTFYKENKFLAVIVLLLKAITYNFANGIVTNSKGSKVSLKKLLIKNKNIDYIYNPYLKQIYSRNKNKRKYYILSVGRLTKQKDFSSLIKAFSIITEEIPQYKLIIVGDGNLKKQLSKDVLDLNLKNKVILTGWQKNLKKYYQHASIFVLPSLYEGLGNVIIDAVNYEIPTIVTNCKSGPNEIILQNKGGYIVPISSPEKLSSTILYAINNYSFSKTKALYSKKYINRFLCETNSIKYFTFLKKIFYGN